MAPKWQIIHILTACDNSSIGPRRPVGQHTCRVKTQESQREKFWKVGQRETKNMTGGNTKTRNSFSCLNAKQQNPIKTATQVFNVKANLNCCYSGLISIQNLTLRSFSWQHMKVELMKVVNLPCRETSLVCVDKQLGCHMWRKMLWKVIKIMIVRARRCSLYDKNP